MVIPTTCAVLGCNLRTKVFSHLNRLCPLRLPYRKIKHIRFAIIMELNFFSHRRLPSAFPLDAVGRQNKFPSRYPDNHDDMCQTERQPCHGINIFVLLRINRVLPSSALSNRLQNICLMTFEFRMPFYDMLPSFIG